MPDRNIEKFVDRASVSAFLRDQGLPVSKKTLDRMAVNGGGPPFRYFGRKPLYRLSEALAWAESRMTSSVANTSSANPQSLSVLAEG